MVMPRFEVRLVGKEPYEVIIANGDLVRWDMRRASENWPQMDKAHNLWASFICWTGSRRTGKFMASWEEWIDQVEGIDFVSQEEADPTPPARGRGSSAK
jgi:hypothetical protein